MMTKTLSLAKFGAALGCVAALALGGAAHAATEVINLGKISTAENMMDTFDFSKGENVIFKFKIVKGLTFDFFAMANTTTITETGGKGTYKYEIFDLKPKGSGYYDLTTMGGAVPEPAAWAFMIIGFGAVGGVARRRSVAMHPKQVST